MLTSIIPVVMRGAVAPEALTVEVDQGDSGVDLTTVTGASMLVRYPNGDEETWEATTSSPTPTSLVVAHTFVDGDTDELGEYRVVVALAVPGGTIRAPSRGFRVVDQWGEIRPEPGL